MIGGDSDEEEGKQESMTGIGASLNPDYRDKEESNMLNQTWC